MRFQRVFEISKPNVLDAGTTTPPSNKYGHCV